MEDRIDILIDKLRDKIQTSDGSPDCQHNVNDSTLKVLEEINKILRTCERDLR